MDEFTKEGKILSEHSGSTKNAAFERTYFGLILILITLFISILDGLKFFSFSDNVENWSDKDWEEYNQYIDFSNFIELMVIPVVQFLALVLIMSDFGKMIDLILLNANETINSDEEIQERFAKVDELQKRFMVKFDNILDKLDEIEKE